MLLLKTANWKVQVVSKFIPNSMKIYLFVDTHSIHHRSLFILFQNGNGESEKLYDLFPDANCTIKEGWDINA
jgi:hypothetical protein